jgi:hypothetical protein
MITLNSCGETVVVPSNSQVRKKGPCKTAVHGPCFLVSDSDNVIKSCNAGFWNGYNYVITWHPAATNYPAIPNAPFSGCTFNRLIRIVAQDGSCGAPLTPAFPLYFREP